MNKDESKNQAQEQAYRAWSAFKDSPVGSTMFYIGMFFIVALFLDWICPLLFEPFGETFISTKSMPLFILAGIAGAMVAEKNRARRFYMRLYRPTMTAKAAPKKEAESQSKGENQNNAE